MTTSRPRGPQCSNRNGPLRRSVRSARNMNDGVLPPSWGCTLGVVVVESGGARTPRWWYLKRRRRWKARVVLRTRRRALLRRGDPVDIMGMDVIRVGSRMLWLLGMDTMGMAWGDGGVLRLRLVMRGAMIVRWVVLEVGWGLGSLSRCSLLGRLDCRSSFSFFYFPLMLSSLLVFVAEHRLQTNSIRSLMTLPLIDHSKQTIMTSSIYHQHHLFSVHAPLLYIHSFYIYLTQCSHSIMSRCWWLWIEQFTFCSFWTCQCEFT